MTMQWWDIAPLGWENILVCLVCGTLVGLERQLRGKPVGIRTSSLIVLGTYCFLAIGAAVQVQTEVHVFHDLQTVVTPKQSHFRCSSRQDGYSTPEAAALPDR